MTIQAVAVKNLYDRKKIDDAGVYKAVSMGIITEEEYKEIVNKDFK